MKRLGYLILAAAIVTSGAPGRAAELIADVVIADTKLGKLLADAKGMTLYTFDNDRKGASRCYGSCAENWPPLIAPESAKPGGDFTIVARRDGKSQWAYRGKPLYGWVRDKKPGDVTGDDFRGIWHVVHP